MLTLEQRYLHALNHATYDRGQIAAFMRPVGAEPRSTDMSAYVEERTRRWSPIKS